MSRRSLLPHALALFVALRVLVLITAFDAVAIPVYEVPPMGNAAWLAATGWRGVPWIGCYDNAGGQLLTAWLAAPLYAVFGSRYLVLKLIPLLLGLGLIAMVWRTLDRAQGRRAANLAALALALAPPLLFKYSLLAKGNHFEGLCFAFAPVWLLFEAEGRARRWPLALAAGLAAGLALSVYLGSLATLVGLAAALLALRGPVGALRDLRAVLPGLAVGVVPLFILHAASAGRTGAFLGKVTSPDTGARFDLRAELHDVLVVHLPDATCCEDLGPLAGAWLDRGYLAASALAVLFLLAVAARTGSARPARALAAVIGLTPLVALAALVVTPLNIRPMPAPVEVGGLRYFVPVHFWTLLALAVVAARALEARARPLRAVGASLAAVLLLAGASSLAIIRPTHVAADLALAYPGHHLRLFTAVMAHLGVVDPATGYHSVRAEDARRALEAMEGADRADVAYSLGSRLWLNALFADPAAELETVLAPLPREDWPAAARGAGGTLAGRLGGAGAVDPARLAQLRRVLAGPLGAEVALGLGTEPEYPLVRRLEQDFRRRLRIAGSVPAADRARVLEGLGIDAGRRLARATKVETALVLALAAELETSDASAFWRGAGRGWRERGPRDSTFGARLQEEARVAFASGLADEG